MWGKNIAHALIYITFVYKASFLVVIGPVLARVLVEAVRADIILVSFIIWIIFSSYWCDLNVIFVQLKNLLLVIPYLPDNRIRFLFSTLNIRRARSTPLHRVAQRLIHSPKLAISCDQVTL